MRQRLVAAFVGLTIVVVGLYGIPRAYFLADLVRSQEQEQVDRMAVVVAVAVDQRRATGSSLDGAFLDTLTSDDDALAVRGADGQVVVSIDTPSDRDGDLTAEHALADGGTVTVTRSGDLVGDDIAQALLPLVLIGLLLVVLAGLVGVVIARRLSRPFQELATAARGLGAGDLRPDLPAYRVPEAREISEALRASGAKIDALLEHERTLATHASHELRTPLTALRLELEDLARWPETPESVAAELRRADAELDRLSGAVTSLLDRAREQLTGDAIDLDLDALVADVVARDGRPFTHGTAGALPTHLDPVPVIQVLELLLAAAPADGLSVGTRDAGTHYEVRIASAPADPAWSRAVETATSVGGHLTRDSGPEVLLRLPKRPVGSTKV